MFIVAGASLVGLWGLSVLRRRRAIATINSVQQWYDETGKMDFSATSKTRQNRFYSLISALARIDAVRELTPPDLQVKTNRLLHSLDEEIGVYFPEQLERVRPLLLGGPGTQVVTYLDHS